MTLNKAILKAVRLIKKHKGYINNVELCYDGLAYFRLAADDDYECMFEKDFDKKDPLELIAVDLKRWLHLKKILGDGWYINADLIKSVSVGRKDTE